MALTGKQQRFVEEYVVDFNATQAAIRAGYSENTAHVIGHENLNKPEIAKEVAKLRQDATTATELTREAVIRGLMDITTENGAPASARVRAWELLGKHLAMFTDRVEVGQIPSEEQVLRWLDELERHANTG